MIVEHVIKGTEDTVLHTFTFRTEGMSLIMSDGNYKNKGKVIISSDEKTVIDIPVSNVAKCYELFLVDDDIPLHVAVTKDGESVNNIQGLIDLLAWFIVPPNVSSLNDIQINVKRVVE